MTLDLTRHLWSVAVVGGALAYAMAAHGTELPFAKDTHAFKRCMAGFHGSASQRVEYRRYCYAETNTMPPKSDPICVAGVNCE